MVGGIPVDPRAPVGSTRSLASMSVKIAQNEPKMSQNDQNACKMRVKTCHGHKRGALRVPEGQICPGKGPKGPFWSNLVRF